MRNIRHIREKKPFPHRQDGCHQAIRRALFFLGICDYQACIKIELTTRFQKPSKLTLLIALVKLPANLYCASRSMPLRYDKVAFFLVFKIEKFGLTMEQLRGNDVLEDSAAVFRKGTSQSSKTRI